MSEPRWTPAQRAAIDDRGGALLVSAAAGSGKTAVLTERAVRLITDPEHPVDADRLLIVTFTNAAAAELRARIGQALLRRCQQEPGNTALRRQRMLLQRAPICTMDAFCLDLLHKHFQALSLGVFFLCGMLNVNGIFSDWAGAVRDFRLLADILQRVLNVSGFMLVLTAIEWLATLVCSILCLYTACMIGHQFKQHFALVGIAAFVGLNVVQNRLVALLPYTNNTVGLDMVVIASGDTWQVTTNRFYLRAVLVSLLADAVLCGVYFAATNWLMKNKLNLD